jgi:hypothetical protein
LNGSVIATHLSRGDGGFDENDVLVALPLPVVVLAARRASTSRQDAQDPASAPDPLWCQRPVAPVAGCLKANYC